MSGCDCALVRDDKVNAQSWILLLEKEKLTSNTIVDIYFICNRCMSYIFTYLLYSALK